jgi:hypothetical protein
MLMANISDTRTATKHKWHPIPAVNLMSVLEFSREDVWTCRAENLRLGLL